MGRFQQWFLSQGSRDGDKPTKQLPKLRLDD